MELQKQGQPSNCGQTCVAMLTGISQWEAMNAFGKDDGSTPKQMEDVLHRLGYETKRLRGRAWPELGIIFVRGVDVNHAVAVKNGVAYDPVGVEMIREDYEIWLDGCGLHVTGGVAITGKISY